MFDSLLFDLDGTLWDTTASCVKAWNQVLEKEKIDHPAVTEAQIRSVTGKSHHDCIRTIFHSLLQEQIDHLVQATSIEDIAVIEKEGGDLYEGMQTGIKQLAQYYPLFIVSNCQEGYIETFLEFSELKDCFVDHECWGRTRQPKAWNTKIIMDKHQLQRSLFIGDTENDALAAQKNAIPYAQMTYGFGEVKNPNYEFNSFSDLVDWLMEAKTNQVA